MNVLLLVSLTCLHAAAEEILPLSGGFNTIYLASNDLKEIAENGSAGILMRNVTFSKNYLEMEMTYYIRKHGKCQQHILTARKIDPLFTKFVFGTFFGKDYKVKDHKDPVIGEWIVDNQIYHFPNILYYTYQNGYKINVFTSLMLRITYISNTTMLFLLQYTREQQSVIRVTAALSKGTNLTDKMRKEYINLTKRQKIPIENIKNVYITDTCPKLEPLTQ